MRMILKNETKCHHTKNQDRTYQTVGHSKSHNKEDHRNLGIKSTIRQKLGEQWGKSMKWDRNENGDRLWVSEE